MKKIIYALAATAMVACNNTTTITGTTDDSMEGATAYLVCDNTNEATDSCVVTGKTFTFTRTEEQPGIYRVQIGRSHLPLLYEAGQQINVDFTNTTYPVTDNGGANTISNEFTEMLHGFVNACREKYAELINNGTPEEAQEYSNRTSKEMTELYKKNIAANKDNIFGAYLLANLAHNLYPDLASLDSVMNEVKYAKEIKHLSDTRASIESKEKTKEGKPFIDFEGKDLDGNPIALSKYVGKGKYTLIDFWASWCGPCRLNNPTLRKIYEKYHSKGLEIIGVSLDTNRESWEKAIEKDGLSWLNVSSLKGWKCDLVSQYSVKGIPALFILDEDNNIIATGLKGELLEKFIEEKLK